MQRNNEDNSSGEELDGLLLQESKDEVDAGDKPSVRRGAMELEESDDDETRLCELLNKSVWDDLCDSLYAGRYASLIVLFLALLISYQLTIAPYQMTKPPLTEEQRSMKALKHIRPVLDDQEMSDIHKSTFYAETTFSLPEPHYDFVTVKFHSTASKHGHFRLPEIFYDGVVYGLTWENSHKLEYYLNGADEASLIDALRSMEPSPTEIFPRFTRNNYTNWNESGLAVRFSNEHLKAQGYLSSDVSQPWKRTLEPVLSVAQQFKLAYIYQWYPHQFGARDASDPRKHEVVVQQVIPTRTGLDGIKSTGTVWVAALNSSEPILPPRMIRKPWTADDHWSNYPVDE